MNITEKRKNRVTIKDVAKAANVSIATVSYVLNNTPGQSISDETRKKVVQFANLLGYECNVMARYLATGKSNTVSALIKDFRPFASQYYIGLLAELSRILWQRNFGLKIVDYADGFKRSTDCDAYITLALSEEEFRTFADTKLIPVIAVDSIFQDFLFYRVNDDYKRLYDQTKVELGASEATLITYALPPEVFAAAQAVFDDVITVETARDILSIDTSKHYATVSSAIRDNAPSGAHIALSEQSARLKASAAADAVIRAIDRIQNTSEEHDIKI